LGKIIIILTRCPHCEKLSVYRGICQNEYCDYENAAFYDWIEKQQKELFDPMRTIHKNLEFGLKLMLDKELDDRIKKLWMGGNPRGEPSNRA